MRARHKAKPASTPKAGFFATLLTFLRIKGAGAPSPAHKRALAFSVAALLALLLPAAANADSSFGEEGHGAGQLQEPQGVAVSRQSGDVYIVETANQRISEFHSDGTFIRAFGWGVLNGAAELQVCTTATGCQHGLAGSGPGQLAFPNGIAVDNDPASPSYGDLWVVDRNNYRVEKFGPTGVFLLMLGGEVDKTTAADLCTAADIEVKHDTCAEGVFGAAPGAFGFDAALTVDSSGHVWVGDTDRLQQFDPDGKFLSEVPLPVPSQVRSLAVDSSGDFYAISPLNTVQLLTPPAAGTFTLTHFEKTSDPLAFNAGVEAVQAALAEVFPAAPQFDVKGPAGGPFRIEYIGGRAGVGGSDLSLTASAGSVTTTQEGGSPRGVEKLNPAGELLQTFDEAGQPDSLALDSSGNLFLGDKSGGEYRFREYTSTGAPFAVFSSPQIEPWELSATTRAFFVRGIAVGDAAGKLYATNRYGDEEAPSEHVAVIDTPSAGPPLITEQHVTDVEPTTATLHAVVNPEGHATEYHFEYGTEAGLYTHSTPAQELPLLIEDHPVSAAISPLTPATTYHYRAVAESECEPIANPGHVCVTEGPDQIFETLPPVSIRDFTTQTVGPELVTIKAELNPNNSTTKTKYTIHYGAQEGDYSLGSCQGELDVGGEFEPVDCTFTGLQPDTPYHYQLTAENEFTQPGPPLKTADAEFTTELSSAEERAAEDCPNGTVHGASNSTLREENSSLALADCRAYEQVSPPYKAGYAILPETELAPGGERAAFRSLGAFTGETGQFSYVAHRTATGWQSKTAVGRPAGPAYQPRTLSGYTAELDRSLFPLASATTAQEAEAKPSPNTYYIGAPDGSFLPASPTIAILSGKVADSQTWDPPIAASADFSRLFLLTNYKLLSEDPLPDSPVSAKNRIYEVSGAGGPSPTMRLLAEVPTGLDGYFGSDSCRFDSQFGADANSSSADGSTLFYDAPLELAPGQACQTDVTTGPNKDALFACDAQAGPCVENLPGYHEALQLSAKSPSQCSSGHPCYTAAPADAHFDGASPDGRLAWFATAQPLIDSDSDATNDLYLAKLENGQLKELVQASAGEATPTHPTPGQGAGVRGVLGVSQDGTHAAFVATGVLTAEANALGQSAQPGAENLYVYDATSGETKFVTQGSVARANSGPEAQLTPDGRYLLFSSFARLTPDDTDTARDVYRYDFQTGALTRVSTGRRGNDGGGNDDAYDARIEGPTPGPVQLVGPATLDQAAGDAARNISADGSTVVFQTAAPLVSHDTNTGPHPSCGSVGYEHGIKISGTGCDVYQWEQQGHGTCHEAGGCISLVSSGLAPLGDEGARISSSGRDITFLTSRGLFPADTDGVSDVYDARVDGGFHTPVEEPCHVSSSHCPGGPVPPPPPPHPRATSTFIGPGNEPTQLHCGKGRHRVTKHGQVRCVAKKHHAKKHHKAGGRK